MYCAKCGTYNADYAKFCKACGNPMMTQVTANGDKTEQIFRRISAICLVTVFIVVGIFIIKGFGNTSYVEDEEEESSYSIIGTWKVEKLNGVNTDIDGKMTFYDDGTLIVDSTKVNYSLSDGSIRISGYSGVTYNDYVCDYELTEDTLIIYDFAGGDVELKRE